MNWLVSPSNTRQKATSRTSFKISSQIIAAFRLVALALFAILALPTSKSLKPLGDWKVKSDFG